MSHILIKEAKCVSLQVTSKTRWRHIILKDQDGNTGMGEFTLDAYRPGYEHHARLVVEDLIGREPFACLMHGLGLNLDDIHEATIASAIDQALRDLQSRQDDIPLWRYHAPSALEADISLYANINRRSSSRTAESFRDSALSAISSGFTAIKIAPFDGLSPEICESRVGDLLAAEAMDRISAVSEVMPEAGELQIDCHWRLTREYVRKLLPKLQDLGVTWLECPIPETSDMLGEIADIRRDANSAGMRLAGCETLTGLKQFRPFIENDCYDVIMPDMKHVGGFECLRAVVEDARENNVAVSLHNPSGPVCHAHSLHAAVALGLNERHEVQFDETLLFSELTSPSLSSHEPHIRLPVGAGIGISLRVEADANQPSNSGLCTRAEQ